MSRRKGDKEMDEMTKLLLSQGVYSLKKSDDSVDKRILKMLKANEKKVYRFWIGVVYGILLLISLYWLPLFGPMIAGYIAGRRAGSPARGTLAGAIIVIVFYAMQNPAALSSLPINIVSMRDSLFSAISYRAKWIAPALSFIKAYTTPTITVLSGQLTYTPQTYTILMVFSYIGGTIAKQKREEIRLMAMGRILSHIPVYPVSVPSPHHSVQPTYEPSVSFEDLEKRSFHPDYEIKRIYEDEYENEYDKPEEKPRPKRVKKEEIIKNIKRNKTVRRKDLL